MEGQINDSFAMREFMGLDFGTQQVSDTTTLLHFRHLFEKHKLGEAMFASLNARLEANGPVDGLNGRLTTLDATHPLARLYPGTTRG